MRLLLLELGAGPLPDTTPVQPVTGTWIPAVFTPPPPPPPGGFAASPIADAVLLTWAASAAYSPLYIVERAPDDDGVPGTWAELTRTSDLRYTVAEPTGLGAWYRVRALSLNRLSDWAAPLVAAPIASNPPRIDLKIVNGEVVVNCLHEQFYLLLTADASVRFVNVPQVKTILMEIQQAPPGGHKLAFPDSVVSVSGVPYVVSATPGALDVVGLTTSIQGATWRLTSQQPVEAAGGSFVVVVTPSPASASATTDGVAAVAPSVTVTAVASGGTEPVVHAWSRADSTGGVDFLVSDTAAAAPVFSIPPEVTAYPATTQKWRDTVRDGSGLQAQATVDVTLERIAPGSGTSSFAVTGNGLYFGSCFARVIGGNRPCSPSANVPLQVAGAVYPVNWTLTQLLGPTMSANASSGQVASGNIAIALQVGSGITNAHWQGTFRVDAQDATGAQASHTFDVLLERLNDQ